MRRMKHYFVDTSGWYDLLFSGSPAHRQIKELLRDPSVRLVTSTYVLDELVSLVLSRSDHRTAAQIGSHIRAAAEVHVEHPDAVEERCAWDLFLQRPDKRYTLTDCLSFVMMRRLGLPAALATDEHFRQEGFETVP